MTQAPLHSVKSWIALLVGFALGSLLDSHLAWGQWQQEVLPAPRSFAPARGGDASRYAGLEFDSHNFGTSRRAGSAMPISSEGMLHGGEVIYEGQPRFIGMATEEIGAPPVDGEVIYESGRYLDGVPHGGCGDGCGGDCGLGGACGGCGGWDGCGLDDCEQCIPLCLPRFRHLTLFAGVQGFKGPRDNGINSNFGFHEGVTISGRAPFIGWRGIGYQIGYRATQTRLHGDVTSREGRVQHFVTAGLFRRSQVGLQYGVAYDYLRDDLDEQIDFSQLRTEISILGPRGGEVGFLGMFHLNNETSSVGNTTVLLEPFDQYLLFIRRRFENCGEGRLWGGFTDRDHGIFGGEFIIPLDDRWSIAGGFNYLIPENDTPPRGAVQEAWNIGISLVWNWNCDARGSMNSPFRPLFNVADNGTMIIDRR